MSALGSTLHDSPSEAAAICPDIKRPMISILVSDLSETGTGRWGMESGDRPFVISKALRLAGYQTEILGLSNALPKEKNIEASLKLIHKQRGIGFWRSLYKLMTAPKGDILYAYKPKVGSFGTALLAKYLYRKPLVIDIDDWELSWHGGDNYCYTGDWQQLYRDLLKAEGALRNSDHPLYIQQMERLIKFADEVTTHNTFLQKRFGGRWLPNGKDIHLFNPDLFDAEACRQELGLSNYRVLMFPGAPRPYKGAEDILLALDILDEPDLKLVIVGGSPYDDYDAYLHRNWGHRLIQLPKTEYRKMPSRIAAAHILVVPQRDDPATRAQFPLKITDGMAMAKPVLATRVGDIPKILGDAGYLVEADSPKALADSIRHIFANYDEALTRGTQARLRCQDHFSVEHMSEILSDIFRSQKLLSSAIK